MRASGSGWTGLLGIVILLGQLGPAGCRRQAPSGPEPLAATPASPQVITELPNLPWRITLPPQAKVEPRSGGVSIALAPRSRYPYSLTILQSSRSAATAASMSRTKELAAGMTIRYRLEKDSGGSGGEEELLQGVIAYQAQTLEVTCHDQREYSAPDATWCLPLLATLRSR